MTMFDCSKIKEETYSKELKKRSALKVSEVDNKIVSIEVKNTNFRFKLILVSVVLALICAIIVYIKL